MGECEGFLRDSLAGLWRELLPRRGEALARRSGISDLTRADHAGPVRRPQFGRRVPRRQRHGARRATAGWARCGWIPDAGGRVRFDVGEREGKRARAFCAPVRVPEEIYLVLRPHRGKGDYHDAAARAPGHAVHFAYTRADFQLRVSVGW